VSPEVVLAAGYAGFLVAAAVVIEWLSAHTHRRALRYRTAGFEYDALQDHWQCPEGQHLWPHEFDTERRLVRYRAKAHICNGCPAKEACTDSDEGREVVRPLDPWPHSEAGRFHRGLSLLLILLSLLVLLAVATRHHEPPEAALMLGLLGLTLATGRRLLRDFLAHPSNFPDPSPSHGLRMTAADAGGRRAHSRWASHDRSGGGP
jgi:Transposase DDE domain